MTPAGPIRFSTGYLKLEPREHLSYSVGIWTYNRVSSCDLRNREINGGDERTERKEWGEMKEEEEKEEEEKEKEKEEEEEKEEEAEEEEKEEERWQVNK